MSETCRASDNELQENQHLYSYELIMEVGCMTAMNLDDPSPILGGRVIKKDGQVPLVNPR
jgi:hypothetical protein